MHRERAFVAGRRSRPRKATSGCRDFPGEARAVGPARLARARRRTPESAVPRGGFPGLRSGPRARRPVLLAAQNRGLSFRIDRGAVIPFSRSPQMPNVSRTKPEERKERAVALKSGPQKGPSPSRMIDGRIEELGDWRGKMLSRLRTLIKQADPEVGRGVEVERGSGVVSRRIDLHRRDVQERREDDLRQGGGARRTHRASSTPASKATPGVPSTSTRARRSTRRR